MTCQHYLRVGDGVGATGALSLEGGSSVTTSNLFAIGVGTDSHGSVTIDGGSTMDVHGMLQMGINSGTAAGTLDLIDGTLDVGNGMIAGLKGKANVSIAKGSTITVPVNGLIIANTASSEALVNFELGHDSMGHPISGRITPYQLLIRSGSKTLSLSFDSAETFRPGDVFTLIDYDDSNWDGNVFDNIGDGGTLTVGGHDFRIDYAGLIGAGDYAVTATVLGPSPITDVSPDIGPVAGGQTVTLTGSGFTNVTDVAFGGISAPSFTVDGDTSITATTPAHPAATVDVTVTTPGGGGTASNAYTFVPSPTIASVSPDIGPVEGGTIVTITGTDLALASDVTFGGVPAASFTVTSDTTITAVTPPHARGTVDVAVTGPGGTATLAGGFTYAGVLEIPTLGGWMLLLFGGLLAAAGALKLRP